MNKTTTPFASTWVHEALFIEALSLHFEKPVTWASKRLAPVYLDNRKFFGFPESLTKLVSGLDDLYTEHINKNDVIDGIFGTSTAGIPWGALLAYRNITDFYMSLNGKVYKINDLDQYSDNLPDTTDVSDGTTILVNGAAGIPIGIIKAYEDDLPFAYEREAQKRHGLKNLIEGNVTEDTPFILMLTTIQDQNGNVIIQPNKDIKNKKNVVAVYEYIVEVTEVTELNGNILITEDLVSTGKSSFEDALTLNKLGAHVMGVLACYSYLFPETIAAFQEHNIPLHLMANWHDIRPVALEQEVITEEQALELDTWYHCPEEWSEKRKVV